MGLGGVALVVVGVAFAVWTSSTPSPKPATPIIPPPQAGGPPATAPELTPTTPSFDIVRVDPSGHAVIAGRAEPGAKVTVLDGDKPLGDKPGQDILAARAVGVARAGRAGIGWVARQLLERYPGPDGA